MKKIILGTSDAWSTKHLSHRSSEPARVLYSRLTDLCKWWCINGVMVFKFLVYSVNNTRCPLLYVISLWKFLVTLWKGSVYQKVSLTQDSQSESLSHLILYKYSFQVDGRRIFCQSQPFPCSYERLFFVLCQYSLVLADITVDTVVSTELQWENLSHFISQTGRFKSQISNINFLGC